MKIRNCISLLVFFTFTITSLAQQEVATERCGTMQRLAFRFKNNPVLKTQFEKKQVEFNRLLSAQPVTTDNNRSLNSDRSERSVYTIPVVFHIVLPNPDVVTNQQLLAQVDTLNKDFFGSNGDSVKIPSYFKTVYGKSGIQFCLAQQTPDGDITNGIERIATRQASFSSFTEAVKHATSGGANAWSSDRYINIWICILSNGIVGYSTFPEDGQADEQGVVVDYRGLPGGAFTQFNAGRTLTHETGHFFNLYHIWGDDDGACTGTDFIDDTPNQSAATVGCFTGIRNDSCTPAGNGVMYQNFMDYSYDNCLALFTTGQVARMESAVVRYRSSLLSSTGCRPAIVRNFDAQLRAIISPAQRLCINAVAPVITVQNRGLQTLTSLTIQTSIDDGNVSSYTWTGSLERLAVTDISLPSLVAPTGRHVLKVIISAPNNNADEDASNNTQSTAFHFYEPVAAVSESFEGSEFPPGAWDVINADATFGWQRVTGIAKTGTASVMISNFNNSSNGRKDDLRLPNVAIPEVDSAYLSFQVAAATYTSSNAANNIWDTLEVLISTDCGATYTSLYKKYGGNLVTRQTATQSAFTPAAGEWRKDSINMAAYIGAGTILIAFRNTNGNENNIYLDDINLRTVTVNRYLKEQGFHVTPNPARGAIAIQFYPQPEDLKAIQLYNMSGQKVSEIITNGQVNNYYNFDISRFQSGTYIVRAVFSNRVVVRKFIKL